MIGMGSPRNGDGTGFTLVCGAGGSGWQETGQGKHHRGVRAEFAPNCPPASSGPPVPTPMMNNEDQPTWARGELVGPLLTSAQSFFPPFPPFSPVSPIRGER